MLIHHFHCSFLCWCKIYRKLREPYKALNRSERKLSSCFLETNKKLSHFLFIYKITPHNLTYQSPAKLVLRLKLDLLFQNLESDVEQNLALCLIYLGKYLSVKHIHPSFSLLTLYYLYPHYILSNLTVYF